MSDWQRRHKRKHTGRLYRRPVKHSDCCILCQLYKQADVQDESWSVSDRADELAAGMRAIQQWDAGFTALIGCSREQVEAFAQDWASHRQPLTSSASVALIAYERFWSSYQVEAAT